MLHSQNVFSYSFSDTLQKKEKNCKYNRGIQNERKMEKLNNIMLDYTMAAENKRSPNTKFAEQGLPSAFPNLITAEITLLQE